MSEPLKLQDLMEMDGVIGALRWQQSRFQDAIAYPARLAEFLGLENEERARQMMLSAEAMPSRGGPSMRVPWMGSRATTGALAAGRAGAVVYR